MAAKSRARSEKGREIGPLPEVVNPRRKARCKKDPRLFAATYFPEKFNIKFSSDHLKALALMKGCVLAGGLFALAMPRGSGKTTLSEVVAIWAVLYGHRRFVVVIGSMGDAAAEILERIKAALETNELLAEDFPEVCYPLRMLEQITQRAKGQTLDGEPTRIGWHRRQVVLPTVAGSAASGSIIRVSGLTGRVRGMSHAVPGGATIRPDLALCDDPQTDASARSPTHTQKRMGIISKAVLGLAGPGKKIAAFLLVTVIARGDLADQFLDRKAHPQWQGVRTKMLYRPPDNIGLWEEYARLRSESFRNGNDGREATEFYLANRAAMDAGAEVAWPERFEPDEVSGLQHAMNLKFRDEAAFAAEYQNEPPDPLAAVQTENLTPDQVAGKLNNIPRGVVPRECSRLTAMVDVQQRILFWAVCGWDDRYGGAVVDYGTFPEQPVAYFGAADPSAPLDRHPDLAGLPDLGAKIYAGLGHVAARIFGRSWPRDGGGEARADLCLIDANWGQSKPAVYDFCRRSPYAAFLLPSHGRYVGPNVAPMDLWKVSPGSGVLAGTSWRLDPGGAGRHVTFDTNHWKSFTSARFRTPPGSPGCLSLFGADPFAHRLFADHCTAEFAETLASPARRIEAWKMRPGRSENHWWDCVVGAAVAASVRGLTYSPSVAAGEAPAGEEPVLSMAEEIARRRRDRGVY